MGHKEKNKRITAMALAALLLMLSFAGCSGAAGKGSAETDENAAKVSRIYLASPFFNDKEEEAVGRAETILRDRGFDVFSPREQTYEEEFGSAEWSKAVFKVDTEEIRNADCVVMLYWGNYSDSGTAWESGYAYAVGTPVVAVHLAEDSNLMVNEGAVANLKSVEELSTYDFEKMPVIDYDGEVI